MHFDNKVVVRTDILTRRIASYTIGAKRLDGQTPLATEVDLRTGHIVLDGFTALRKRGTAPPPLLDHVCCGHGRPSQLLLSSCHLCSLLERCSLYRIRSSSSAIANVFALAANGDGACFWLTFWTVGWPHAWCIIRPCIQYTAGAASMAGAWFIHWPVQPMWPVRGL